MFLNYVIAHVPHASAELPFRAHYSGDVDAELALVTDWATDCMVIADESIVFPFSRLWCDVERLTDDALNARGLGLYGTRRLNGEALRTETEPYLTRVLSDYHDHHKKVIAAIVGAISLMPVCLLDVHSYSAQQAALMGFNETCPDICLGYDDVAPDLIGAIATLFKDAGYSVGENVPYRGALAPAAFQDNPDFLALMVEVNKSVYLDDDNGIIEDRFTKLRQVMAQMVDLIRNWSIGA